MLSESRFGFATVSVMASRISLLTPLTPLTPRPPAHVWEGVETIVATVAETVVAEVRGIPAGRVVPRLTSRLNNITPTYLPKAGREIVRPFVLFEMVLGWQGDARILPVLGV